MRQVTDGEVLYIIAGEVGSQYRPGHHAGGDGSGSSRRRLYSSITALSSGDTEDQHFGEPNRQR